MPKHQYYTRRNKDSLEIESKSESESEMERLKEVDPIQQLETMMDFLSQLMNMLYALAPNSQEGSSIPSREATLGQRSEEFIFPTRSTTSTQSFHDHVLARGRGKS